MQQRASQEGDVADAAPALDYSAPAFDRVLPCRPQEVGHDLVVRDGVIGAGSRESVGCGTDGCTGCNCACLLRAVIDIALYVRGKYHRLPQVSVGLDPGSGQEGTESLAGAHTI